MSKQDRKNLSILVVLLGVLGLTLFLGYRLNQPSTTATAQTPPETKPGTGPTSTGAQLLLNLVEKQESGEDIGKKNPFAYHQAPPPPQRGPFPGGPSLGGPAQPGNTGLPPTGLRPPTPVPPGPPPIPLKYQGYLVLDTPTGGFTAVVADEARHYNVTVGEVLMGRYRILAITDKVVDVEDLEYNNRRQSLPIAK
jgi:hypothetical protein